MGNARSVMMVAWVVGGLGGCVTEEPERERSEEPTNVVIERLGSAAHGLEQASQGCDGTPLPSCDGPFTGASCDLPCALAPPGLPPRECGVDRYCHSDGSTYGLAARNAVLYPASPDEPDEAVQANLEAWIVEHPADLGLEAGLTADDLELHRMNDFRSSAGALTIFRFGQTYRGIPVLAPDGIVTVVYGPQGAISITGAIIDGRTPYEHADAQVHAAKAIDSILAHADAQIAQASVQGLRVEHATPVAMPMAKAIGWAGFVRQPGGPLLARVIVDADPGFAGAVQPLWSFRELVVSGLGDTQQIDVHTLDGSSDPTSLAYADRDVLTTGAPLLGSMYDATLQLQLATERVVVLTLGGERSRDVEIYGARVLDPVGDFSANTGPELSAQTAYHLIQSWYDYTDEHLSDPVTGTKQWDSANLLYSDGMSPGDTPPGTYSPRVLVFSNTSSADCPVSGIACVRQSGYKIGTQEVSVFPELAHIPAGASMQETTGNVILPGEGVEPITFAHEFGHIVDLFTGGGLIKDFAPDCGNVCVYECVVGTTDEAPPLSESVAQLFTFVFLLQAFDGVDWQHCSIVDLVSRNGTKSWTPGPCIPPGEDISLLLRSDDCTKPSDQYCDRPEQIGVGRDCCYDDEDLGDCTLIVPSECPVGEVGATGGLGTGTARPEPTGACDPHPGYSTNSLFQAFWQMLNGQRCDPTPPFACVSVDWAPGVTPMDAATDALIYAMRINALTYDQLVDGMATYVSCNYGEAAYDEFNAVACAHGLRDCAAPAPMMCEDCGNGVREGTETCDGADWLYASCDDLPEYAGGTLSCDENTCALDYAQCSMPSVDTTAGTDDPIDSSTSMTPYVETETTGAAGVDPGGCDCRASSGGRWLILIPLFVLGVRRRRRAA
ncbi:hypothetical protein [Paraliomyxa miuraensis]|uniref:hypothetical protein n=1 Tax=Paraliomyxa miuraensis TaxID=376150 RepID=UPI002254EC08|nr:hypothetical protein [Paraliomyxa miuraensis]MCX4246747.1 hypothetical protein [Paraliomyxa miuraensis]